MTKTQVVKATADYVRQTLEGEGSGHDWWHIYRVWKMALLISKTEKVDRYIVELGALLHDIADFKFYNGDETVGPRVAREWLTKQGVAENNIAQVVEIIEKISFKGAGVKNKMKSIEGLVVQDADRLDAIGAIGVARTFAYGGFKGHEMHNPETKPELHATADAYKKSTGTTINHFYEKLLLLKERMNTKSAKRIALKRHKYMESYLTEFYAEWEGRV